jgi:hypothetical protein
MPDTIEYFGKHGLLKEQYRFVENHSRGNQYEIPF